MARDGVPNFVCRKARRSDSVPSIDKRCRSCSASPSARCAAGTSSSAAAPMSATAIRVFDPHRSGEVLRQPGEGSVCPERDVGCRHEQHEQERARHGGEAREQGDEDAGALEGLEAGRPQLVRRARHGVAAPDGRERKREAEEIDERGVEYPPAGDGHGRGRRRQSGPRHRPPGHADQAPGRQKRQDADRDPDAARDAVRREVQPDAGAEPQHARQQHGYDGGEVFRAQKARSRQPAIAVSATVAAYWPTTMQASAARRSRSARPAAAAALAARGPKAWWTRATAPPGSRSAQLSMSMARTNAPTIAAASTNHAAESPSDESQRTSDEERADAELCDCQRGRLPHRHERQQRCRGQNDPYLTSGPILEWDGHRVEEPRRMIARTPTRRGSSRSGFQADYRFATTTMMARSAALDATGWKAASLSSRESVSAVMPCMPSLPRSAGHDGFVPRRRCEVDDGEAPARLERHGNRGVHRRSRRSGGRRLQEGSPRGKGARRRDSVAHEERIARAVGKIGLLASPATTVICVRLLAAIRPRSVFNRSSPNSLV